MAINKEFTCLAGHPFEAIAPICPVCGRAGLRAFRTPPHISKGAYRKVERGLELEFRRRGLTNYSNAGGLPRPSFRGLGTVFEADGTVSCGDVRAGCVSPSAPFRGGPLAGLEGQVSLPSFARGRSIGSDAPNPSGGASLAALTEIVTDDQGKPLSYSSGS